MRHPIRKNHFPGIKCFTSSIRNSLPLAILSSNSLLFDTYTPLCSKGFRWRNQRKVHGPGTLLNWTSAVPHRKIVIGLPLPRLSTKITISHSMLKMTRRQFQSAAISAVNPITQFPRVIWWTIFVRSRFFTNKIIASVMRMEFPSDLVLHHTCSLQSFVISTKTQSPQSSVPSLVVVQSSPINLHQLDDFNLCAFFSIDTERRLIGAPVRCFSIHIVMYNSAADAYTCILFRPLASETFD